MSKLKLHKGTDKDRLAKEGKPIGPNHLVERATQCSKTPLQPSLY